MLIQHPGPNEEVLAEQVIDVPRQGEVTGIEFQIK